MDDTKSIDLWSYINLNSSIPTPTSTKSNLTKSGQNMSDLLNYVRLCQIMSDFLDKS